MLRELVLGGCDRKSSLTTGHCGQPLSVADRFGKVLVVPVVHLRLVVEQVHLRRTSDHVKVDDVLCFRGEVWQRWNAADGVLFPEVVGAGEASQGAKGCSSQGVGPLAKKLPARLAAHILFYFMRNRWMAGHVAHLWYGMGHLLSVSSRFSNSLTSMVQPASSLRSTFPSTGERPTASSASTASGWAW